MKLKGLVLAVVVFLVAYVVGGNIYLRVQVKKGFYQGLSKWEEKVNREVPPGHRIKIDVKNVEPSFTLLPFLSPSTSFLVKGIRCSLPRGEVSLRKLVGVARVSLGKVKGIMLTAVEGLEARSEDGSLEVAFKRLVFSPNLDLSRVLGLVKEVQKEIGGKLEGVSMSFIDKKGGEMDLAVREIAFREEVDLGKNGDLPPVPLMARSLLKEMTLSYHAVGGGKGTGEAYFDQVAVDTGLKRDRGSEAYTFWEEVKAVLSKLKLVSSREGNEKAFDKLLPLKGDFRLELANLSHELVASVLELLRAYRGQSLDEQQRLTLMLQFLQKVLPPLMTSTLKGDACLEFPQDASVSFHFQQRILEIMHARRSGNPLWMTVEVKGRDRLLALLSQGGLKDEGVEKFFSGLTCKGDVCEKKIPLGKGRHKS